MGAIKRNFSRHNLQGVIAVLLLFTSKAVDARHDHHIEANAEQYCRMQGLRIYKADEGLWCCNCPAGYYKYRDCRLGLPTTTNCQKCPFRFNEPSQQTFMDVDNNATQCFPVKTPQDCKMFMNTDYIFGSTVKDASCQCKQGYFAEHGAMEFGCHEHGKCIPGFHPQRLGTKSYNTMCVECPPGTYSDIHSATAACVAHTVCDKNDTELQKGNSTADTVCVSQEVTEIKNISNVEDLDSSTALPGTAEVSSMEEKPWPHSRPVVMAAISILIVLIAVLCFMWWKKRKATQQVDLSSPESLPEEKAAFISETLLQTECGGRSAEQQSFKIVNETGTAEGTQAEMGDSRLSGGTTTEDEYASDTGSIDRPSQHETEIMEDTGKKESALTMKEHSHICSKEAAIEDKSAPCSEGHDKSLQHESFKIVNETGTLKTSKPEKEHSGTYSENGTVEIASASASCATRRRASNCSHRGCESSGFEEKFRNLFRNEDLEDAKNKGIRNCCIERAMKDDKIGKLMMETLRDYDLDETRVYIRTLLSELRMKDDEHDAHFQASETRAKWISSVKKTFGRLLTPTTIYKEGFTLDGIKDNMSAVFFKQLCKCESCRSK